jgi:hypothetical protein
MSHTKYLANEIGSRVFEVYENIDMQNCSMVGYDKYEDT